MTNISADKDECDLRLMNEFAEVLIQRVRHGNGTRLRIVSPRAGTEAFVDPVVLEALTSVDPEELTRILVAAVPGNPAGNRRDRPSEVHR